MRCGGSFFRFLFLWLIVGYGANVHGQVDTLPAALKLRDMFSIGVGVQHGFIFAHSEAVENTKGSHPTGVEVILSWQRNDSAIWSLCNCYPRKGLLLSYYDYDNQVLGKSITAAYFLEPSYRLSDGAFFAFKGAAGLSYLTNPFDSLKNPNNMSYSTRINGYLLLGVGLWFRLGRQWWLNTSANYQHESNGGLREPNKGINWPTAGLALSYQPDARTYFRGTRVKEKFWRDRPLRWDVAVFGIARRSLDENGQSRRLPLVGLGVQGAKQVGRINNLTLGLEGYYDEELHQDLQKDSLDVPPVKVGLQVGHEFILGRFLFSQQLGVYLYDKTPYFDQLYHRWGIVYRAGRHLGIGFNLKAHRQVADFADLRVVYSFGE